MISEFGLTGFKNMFIVPIIFKLFNGFVNRPAVQFFLLFPILVIVMGCSATSEPAPADEVQATGKLQSDMLTEVSGVAVSSQLTNTLYVHNDSGDSSRFFAITPAGSLLCTYSFQGVSTNGLGVVDCEDIALGPGPVAGQSYVYLADIGDNDGTRSSIQVYRLKEPGVHEGRLTLEADVLNLQYPDKPRDAETILVDPVDRLLYIISKREDTAGIYRCPLDFQNNDQRQLELCGKLFIEGSGTEKWIVSGNISRDGNDVLIKTVSSVYYWKRSMNEPVNTVLQRSAIKQAAYKVNGQEEAISFTTAGDGYYVLSEGKASTIYYYKLAR